MDNKYIFGAVLVAVSVLFSALLIKPVTKVVNTVTDGNLGAVPVLNSPLEVNGMNLYMQGKSLTGATTTVCAIKSPAATSTLASGMATFYYATSSAVTVRLSKASTYNSTTSPLAVGSLGVGAQGTITASSSPMGAIQVDGVNVFSPNTYFVVSVEGGSIGTVQSDIRGTCRASFIN